MNYRILFIVPPYSPKNTSTVSKIVQVAVPYGILSMASYINQSRKHEILIVDMNVSGLDNALCFSPNIVCISASCSTSYSHIGEIADTFRAAYPDCLILAGGGFATNAAELLLTQVQSIDAVCYGEGEIPLDKLVNITSDWSQLHKLSSAWITRNSLAKCIKPSHDFVEDLDSLPIVDYSYVDHRLYNERSMDKSISSGKVELSIHTSRGCPFQCIFCSNGATHGKRIRRMSSDQVMKTVQEYVLRYGMTHLLIEDDHFLSDKKRAIQILNKLSEMYIQVEFPNGIAVHAINPDMALAMSRAGTKAVPLAVESGSDFVLRNIIKKPLTRSQILPAVTALRNCGILVHMFIVIGLPGETDAHRNETLNMLLEVKPDWAYVFIAIPIHGSALYKLCQSQGYLIHEEFDRYTADKCNIVAPGICPEKIEEFAYYCNVLVNFIRNRNFLDGNYEICLRYFRSIAAKYPDHAAVHYALSRIYMKQGRAIMAMRHMVNCWKTIHKNHVWSTIFRRLKLERQFPK